MCFLLTLHFKSAMVTEAKVRARLSGLAFAPYTSLQSLFSRTSFSMAGSPGGKEIKHVTLISKSFPLLHSVFGRCSKYDFNTVTNPNGCVENVKVSLTFLSSSHVIM